MFVIYNAGSYSTFTTTDHLLRPTFLIELLRSMEMNSHNYMIHATNITFALKKVPIVSASFPKQQMKTLIASRKEFRQLVPDEEEAILEWAEKLELIYSLGRSGEHMLYFVPFLATEALGDQANYDWDYDEAEGFQARDITVLYAKIHIPASHQFFYGLIAELLKDVLMVYSATMEKNILCTFVHFCMEINQHGGGGGALGAEALSLPPTPQQTVSIGI